MNYPESKADDLAQVRIARLEGRSAPAEQFRITVLCTGNRFRSPIAAAVIETLTDGLPVEVRSMGTEHVGTVGAMPEAIHSAGRLGIDVTGHVARLATAADVAHADLVLGFELAHLARARQLGAQTERIFTLPDLAVTVEELPYESVEGESTTDRARRIVSWAHGKRLQSGNQLREIRDPARAGSRHAYSIAREVHYNASIIVGYLFDTIPNPSTSRSPQAPGYPATDA